MTAVVRTYLELTDPSRLRGATIEDPSIRIRRAPSDAIALFRTVYRDVGAPFHWRDRDTWTDEMLHAHLQRPDTTFWVLTVDDDPAGFFELRQCVDGSVEIVYFGLAGRYIGRGLGKHLLTRAVEEAWALGGNRVWLHTCTLDSAAALPNYRARGFVPFKTETYEANLPTAVP
jgi:ribosomal protein S18 acetylase RimI-like enzyme